MAQTDDEKFTRVGDVDKERTTVLQRVHGVSTAEGLTLTVGGPLLWATLTAPLIPGLMHTLYHRNINHCSSNYMTDCYMH